MRIPEGEDTLMHMPARTRLTATLTSTLLAAAVLAGCTPTEPSPDPSSSESIDPRAVSSTFETTKDGLIEPGSGVTVGTTVPTEFADSSGTWTVDLTVVEIVAGSPSDLDVVKTTSADLSGLTPYYTTITATVTGGEGNVSSKSIGTLFSYVTESGASAPELVSVNGAFTPCGGSSAFPVQPDPAAVPAPSSQSVAEAKTITFCQVSLATDADPVDQVNWHPTDTPYDKDSGKPIFFRPSSE